ncbi:hypothetical protein [Cellulomonas sp.]|uniref:hypothetical protein n=1 Tax=Cellulomonas sp. TaxID=40001 RepID=UPI002D71EF49|nr:hypothetical protein [Cellulomonas sp.]HYQ76410.1 hypothetical protein [Cellulomonas sp.]
MVSPSQLASWQPARLSEIAEALVEHRRSLTGLHDDLDAGKPPASWTFEDASAARAEHARLADALATQVAETTGVIEALDAAATSLAAAKELLQGAMRRGGYNGLHIDHATGAVSLARSFDDEDELAYARTVQHEVAEQIETALADAAAADQALAAALNAAATTDVNDIGSLADQQAVLDFQAKSPADQVRYLLDHPEAYALLGEHLSDEAKGALGTEVADGLDRMAREWRDFTDAGTVAQYTALLDAFGDDPQVMAALFERLGPDGLLGAYTGLSLALYDVPDRSGLTRLAEELRSGLQVATTDPRFDQELFGQDLVRYATATADHDAQLAYDRTYAVNGGEGAVIDFLLREGTYGEDFVRGVTWELDEFERGHPERAELWTESASLRSPLGGLGLDPASPRMPDPMGAALGQLAHYPASGLEFFSEEAEARAQYYLADRDWRDGFQGIAEVVRAVGTDADNLRSAPADTGMFVARAFDMLPRNEGFSVEGASLASEPIADLLKYYMPALDAAVAAGKEGLPPWLDVTSNPYLPRFDDYPMLDSGDATSLLRVAVSSEEGMARMAEGVAGYRHAMLAGVTEHHLSDQGLTEEGRMAVQNILGTSARVEGAVQAMVGAVAVEGARSQDQQVAAFTSLVSEAVGLIPVPFSDEVGGAVGDLGKKAWDAAWGQVTEIPTDRVTDAFGSNEAAARDAATGEAIDGRNKSVISSYLALVNAGVVEVPPEMRDVWQPGGRLITMGDIETPAISSYFEKARHAMMDLVDEESLLGMYQDPFVGLGK